MGTLKFNHEKKEVQYIRGSYIIANIQCTDNEWQWINLEMKVGDQFLVRSWVLEKIRSMKQ